MPSIEKIPLFILLCVLCDIWLPLLECHSVEYNVQYLSHSRRFPNSRSNTVKSFSFDLQMPSYRGAGFLTQHLELKSPKFQHSSNRSLSLSPLLSPLSSPLPPPLPTPPPHHCLTPNPIPLPQQRRNIHIQRTIHPRIRQHLPYSFHRHLERVRRCPRIFQKIETYIASLRAQSLSANFRRLAQAKAWRTRHAALKKEREIDRE